MIRWSLLYLGIAASLVGVLGALGTKLAIDSLGLEPKDFIVVVLPLGFGVVMGILILNNFGHLLPRRRIIEGGLIALGILLFLLAAAGPISRAVRRAETATGLVSMADFTSLLSIVVLLALLAGIAYAFVAIPAQTQLQEDIPEEARGRVFGVLNMLVSVASFLPFIVAGSLADVLGTTTVLYMVGAAITASGILSIVLRGPLKPAEVHAREGHDPARPASTRCRGDPRWPPPRRNPSGPRRHRRRSGEAAAPAPAIGRPRMHPAAACGRARERAPRHPTRAPPPRPRRGDPA